jgi:hypothetical protein
MATDERRKNDGEILKKLEETNACLVTLDKGVSEIKIQQGHIIKRLDTINGTVADYNQNKYKMDLACKEILENREEHKNFIGVKLFATVAAIISILIVASTLLKVFM